MIVSSVPCLSSQIFGWDSQRAGFFMATMGVRREEKSREPHPPHPYPTPIPYLTLPYPPSFLPCQIYSTVSCLCDVLRIHLFLPISLFIDTFTVLLSYLTSLTLNPNLTSSFYYYFFPSLASVSFYYHPPLLLYLSNYLFIPAVVLLK